MLTAATLLAACVQRENALKHGAGQGADLELSGTASAPDIGRGQSVDFHLVVSNNGPHDAHQVRIIDTVGKQSRLLAIACTPRAPAVCPAQLGPSMLVERLPSGAALEFKVTVRLAGDETGTILNSMSASVPEDADPNNNVVTNDVLVRAGP